MLNTAVCLTGALALANVASAATVGRRDAALTYSDVLDESEFENYIDDLAKDKKMKIETDSDFSLPATATPYNVVKFENAAALVLDPLTAIPPDNTPDDRLQCTDTQTCCADGAAGDACRAWFDLFMSCYSACADDSKCTAVEVRMNTGECALFDGIWQNHCGNTKARRDDSNDNKPTFYMLKKGAGAADAPAPEGYTAKPVKPDNVNSIKEVPVTAEPCGAGYLDVRTANVAQCATQCSADAACTSFVYDVDSDNGQAKCKLYGSLTTGTWDAYSDSVLYVKDESIKCPTADEYFSFVENKEADQIVGCKPFLKEGEMCGQGDCMVIHDWTSDNQGCAAGLACLQTDQTSSNRTCVAPGNFTEEAKRQLKGFHAWVGKALDGADAGENSTDLVFYDMAGSNWDYLSQVAQSCQDLCNTADETRACTAFELNKDTQQCIVAYGAVCASSFVPNENATTIVVQDPRVVEQVATLKELAGYSVITKYYPVVPKGKNDNVKIQEIPCADYHNETSDIAAIETECLKACDEWEGCHTVLFRSWGNNCVLFAGEEGKNFTADAEEIDVKDRITFVSAAKVGCTADQFYGFLVETNKHDITPDTYANASVTAEWDAVKAARGYGDATPLIVDDPDCGDKIVTAPAVASCINYLKAGDMCKLETDPEQQFIDLLNSEADGCAAGLECDDNGDDEVITEPARCKVRA